ncbi:MAG: sulfatase-like hydrolase/transferase [bacterium]
MAKPNILIFMTDHQRGDTVLPEHPAITPNLDKFANEGVIFTRVYCPSPHCCPSRATFFSGLYPSRSGVWNNICNSQALSTGLKKGVKLWSEDLVKAGYKLYFSGKWHVSIEESPKDRGWHELFVSANAGTVHGESWEHYRKISQISETAQRKEGEILRPGYGAYRLYGIGSDQRNNHDKQAINEAIEILPKITKDSNPWCLYIGTIGPHDPYIVPKRFVDMYNIQDIPLPPNYYDDMKDKPAIYRRIREMRFGQLSELEIRDGIRYFWAYCTYLDELFGKILDALDETGVSENTLVIYCSDHGDYCGEHGLFAKGIPCFQGAYNVPAVMRLPSLIKSHKRIDEFVSLADFAPTIIELAGLNIDRHFSGYSFLPFLRDEKPNNWRDEIHTQCNGVELYYTQRSVMTKDFKYVFNGFDFDELYDLRSDPYEMENLSGNPAYEEVKREMCKRMWKFSKQENDGAINGYITVGLAPYGPAEAFR